jgi:hypothetical protein
MYERMLKGAGLTIGRGFIKHTAQAIRTVLIRKERLI